MTREQILEKIRKDAGLANEEQTLRAARSVVCSLRDRLSGEEAGDLEEALRGDLPELLTCEAHPHRAPERTKDRLTEPEMAERVRTEAGLADQATARRVIRVVLAALSSRFGGEEEATAGNIARGLGSLAARPKSRTESGGEED